MTAKPKKIDVSSTKSMDVTTKIVTDTPPAKDAEPKIVLNGQKHIKDVSPGDIAVESSSATKINISENLASNLKSPIETKKTIEPIEPMEPTKSTIAEDKSSDDLTESGDQNRDESFIDKISDEENTDEVEKTEDKPNEPEDENQDYDADSESSRSGAKDDEEKESNNQKTDEDKTKPEPEAEAQSQDSGDEGIVNELAEQAADNKKQKQEQKVQDEHDQKVEALISDKKYYVPVGQITHRRNTRLFVCIILLIIIGGLFAINLAIDAGMLDIGVEPLTDFIAL